MREDTHVVRVTIVDSVHSLPDDLLDQIQWTLVGVLLDHIQNSQLTVVEHQMEATLPAEHLDQIDEIRVLQLAQHAHLSHGNLSDDWIGVIF